MELGVYKTLLAKVRNTYYNKDLSNDYSSWLSVIDTIELRTECEEKANNLFWYQNPETEKRLPQLIHQAAFYAMLVNTSFRCLKHNLHVWVFREFFS